MVQTRYFNGVYGTISLNWLAPSDDGMGSAIKDYLISYKTGSAAFVELASGITGTSYTATSLPLGPTYTFAVRARN